ncbi:hypothetical protein NJO91_20955 [Streptomyces microflavus]|uniref:DUF6197 family protein n=1 Tax=Streptomyces microflavus TaxID=1919 RepID=UPI0029A7BB93|nr:hypothetical protein [Streptomyces microflavus]MDX2405576.1 hypothetical protein [Streptomyces microflavus]
MATPVLTPDQLDAQASRLHDTQAWQRIVSGWEITAPEPVLSPAEPPEPVVPGRCPSPAQDRPADWRSLLSVPVDRLIDDSLRALPAAPPPERPLPGRLGAVLPDRVHAWRRVGQRDLRPSVHLGYARQVLTEWGWQNTPYRLRNARGARCICGAMLTAHRLGYGFPTTVNQAGAWLITELRSQGWPGLIGPWNRAPGRTAADALALIDGAVRRASLAGH